MILFVITVICFIALLGIGFSKHQKKVLIMAALVILLLIFNFANEIQAYLQENQFVEGVTQKAKQKKGLIEVNFRSNRSIEVLQKQLTEQQREIAIYLLGKYQNRENLMIHFRNLHETRLALILQLLKLKNNLISEWECWNCGGQLSLVHGERTYLLVYDLEIWDQELARWWLQDNGNIIFMRLPNNFQWSILFKYTKIYLFSNNYLSKILQNHPARAVQLCGRYRTFDYQFYSGLIGKSLVDWCTDLLPSSKASLCVRDFVEEGGEVPLNLVRGCFSSNDLSGIQIRNGFVSVKKDYFWSGRTNRSLFTDSAFQL